MSFADYHFVTHWNIQGPIDKIYSLLKDGEGYARWWRPAYQITERVGEKKVKSIVRAKLPYTLTFTTELVREVFPHEIEIKASGELAGRGLWKLEPKGEMTHVTFFWDVRAEHPFVRWLSPLLKPLFVWNHDWVMKIGETRLQEEIDRRGCISHTT